MTASTRSLALEAALHFLLFFASGPHLAAAEDEYTSNAVCRQNYCVNPVFPGLDDLPRLETIQWQCQTHSASADYMEFCRHAVNYDPAVPSPNSSSIALNKLIKSQDDAAATMFFYHLSGMGYEPWDHKDPANDDDHCVQSVWKMVCYTYFPRAEAGCQSGQVSSYRRPCKSSCQNY